MKIEEYQKIIEQTAVYPTTVQNFGLAYCYLGLIGEYDEFLKVTNLNDAKKEFGDVVWYITAFCKEADIDLKSVFNNPKENLSLQKIAEDIKKYYRDNKPLNKDKITNVLSTLLYNCKLAFSFTAEPEPNIEEILEINYTKLMKRRETNTLHGDGDNREVTE